MWGDRWGVTAAEVAREYPCDRLHANPSLQAWRGVDVDAPAALTWQWVGQVRRAPYSYDWIDNLGRRSPRRAVDLPEPMAGEPFTRAFGRAVGRIVHVEPGESLTARIMGATMSYVVSTAPDGGTRLLLKVVAGGPRPLSALLSVGDLVMARKQLLTLAALAERDHAAS